MKTKLVFSILICFTLIGCKKKIIEPIPDANSPVFFVRGIFPTDSVRILAGVDGAYIQPIESVFNGVRTFEGKLIQGNQMFSIKLFNGSLDKTVTASSFASFDSLRPTQASTSMTFSSALFPGMPFTSLNWKLNGVDKGPIFSVFESGVYTVCAEIVFPNATTASICREIYVGHQRGGNYDVDFIQATDDLGNPYFKYAILNATSTIQSITVKKDGVFYSNLDQDSITYTGLQNVVEFSVKFQNGSTDNKYVSISTASNVLRDFDGVENTVTSYDDFAVEVSCVDLSGVYWTSSGVDNVSFGARLISKGLYVESTTNQQVAKMDSDFSFKLRNPITGQVKVFQGRTTLAFPML
jgi:hypothetical protein